MKKTLPSGAELDMTLAPFAVGHRLFKSVAVEIESVKSSADIFDVMKCAIARMFFSPAIESAMWACAERATYNNVKISTETFEDERAREDFIIVAKEVIWFNLLPFSKNLALLFTDIMQRVSTIQKSKS